MREQRSRRHRRVKVRTPGGEVKVVYKKKKPGKAECANCGAVLKGVPRERPYKMRKKAKTERRPERPYGGVLCARCTRELMVEKARSMYKEEKQEEK